MNTVGLAICTFGVLALPTVAQADPLAPAKTGSLQCYSPDTGRKTCNALAGYTWDAQGKISNQAEVLLSPQQLVVMKTVSPVEVRGDAVCGPLRKEDIDVATISVQGHVLPDAQAAQIRSQLETAYGARLGKEVCTTYIQRGDKFTTRVTVGGADEPEMAETVIWVRPGDGYKVAP